jgi:C_GCAxxG_C_C family probable redox protein
MTLVPDQGCDDDGRGVTDGSRTCQPGGGADVDDATRVGGPIDPGAEAATEARRRVRELFLDDGHVHGCAESAFVALKRAFGLPDPDDASPAMALNGGIAYTGATCGAITGAALALGMLAERRLDDHRAAKRAARLLTVELMRRFEEEFGATTCKALTGADLSTEEGHQAFIDGGAWRDGCLRQLESVVTRLAPLGRDDAWISAVSQLDEAAEGPVAARLTEGVEPA